MLYLVVGLSFNPFSILAIHYNRRRETISMPKYSVVTRDDVVSQRLKFGSALLSFSWESKIALFFLTFSYPAPVPKNCGIFIGCNCKSRASQVGLHKQKKDTASAKKGKVSLKGLCHPTRMREPMKTNLKKTA